MAHPCIGCGGECYCSGSWDDGIVDKTPKTCESCGCIREREELLYMDDDDDNFPYIGCPGCGREFDAIDIEYRRCSRCDFYVDEDEEGGEG